MDITYFRFYRSGPLDIGSGVNGFHGNSVPSLALASSETLLSVSFESIPREQITRGLFLAEMATDLCEPNYIRLLAAFLARPRFGHGRRDLGVSHSLFPSKQASLRHVMV